MKQPTPDRWHAYMHECAERCRRQLAAAAHARGRPRITSYDPSLSLPYSGTVEGRWIGPPLAHDPYRLPRDPPMTATEVRLRMEGRSLPGHERPADWFESVTRKGCTDE